MSFETNQNVMIFSCPDQRGLIFRITDVLLRHGLNIIENHEFVDRRENLFFMRAAVEGAFDRKALNAELRAQLSDNAKIEFHSSEPKKLVLFGTREPHCVGDLLLRHSTGELNAQILAVISQFENLRNLVERFDIPFCHIPCQDISREDHEHKVEQTLQAYRPDHLILARYMRVLTPSFVGRYAGKIVNIHHSFLPAFIGEKAYVQAFERGVKIVGATAHFVTEELDEGPIIVQGVTPVNHTQDHHSIARAGAEIEKMVLAKAVKLVLENRVLIHGRRTLIFD